MLLLVGLNEKMQNNITESKDTEPIYGLIDIETWLNDHNPTYELLKWLTKDWGEIPADFGRKN